MPERLAWLFYNPNHLGTWAAVVAVTCWIALPGWKIALGWRMLLWLPGMASVVVLILSGSRGGMVAVVAGGLAGLTLRRPGRHAVVPSPTSEVPIQGTIHADLPAILGWVWIRHLAQRWPMLALIGVVGMALWSAPMVRERLAALASSGDDPVTVRQELWSGAAALVWAHPSGIGDFGSWYEVWHQPARRLGGWPVAINDYLHIGAESGIVVAMGILAGFGGLIAGGWAVVRRASLPCWLAMFPTTSAIAASTAALVTFAVACFFTNHLIWFLRISWPILIPTAVVVVAIIRGWRQVWRSVVVGALVAGVGGGVAILGVGWWVTERNGFIPLAIGGPDSATPALAVPVGQPCRGTVLVLGDSSDPTDELGRFVLRPLVQAGWRVHQGSEFTAEDPRPHAVVGMRSGAGEVWSRMGELKPDAVVLADREPDWGSVADPGVPVLVLRGKLSPVPPTSRPGWGRFEADVIPYRRLQPASSGLAPQASLNEAAALEQPAEAGGKGTLAQPAEAGGTGGGSAFTVFPTPWGQLWPNRFPRMAPAVAGWLERATMARSAGGLAETGQP